VEKGGRGSQLFAHCLLSVTQVVLVVGGWVVSCCLFVFVCFVCFVCLFCLFVCCPHFSHHVCTLLVRLHAIMCLRCHTSSPPRALVLLQVLSILSYLLAQLNCLHVTRTHTHSLSLSCSHTLLCFPDILTGALVAHVMFCFFVSSLDF
jgi:hypothetical protein